jgi:fructose-bisphosphate aldolase, class II
MELRSLDEIAHAAAAIVAGNLDALDRLVWTGVFGAEPARDAARAAVLDQCRSAGVYPASIHELYIARGRGEVPSNFTVPAINIRGLAYDTARALIRARRRLDAGAVICEIARSEITYTDQRPAEYVFVMLAAALREGWQGPVFIQGDHFQINAKKWATAPDPEIEAVEGLTAEAIGAGFYNIDVDSSTLVDLSQQGHEAQQRMNGEVCARLTGFIRRHEPKDVTISIGGEIGEVGTKNSTVEELHAFMKVYEKALDVHASDSVGISKISIQTGTSHGGVPLPDGTIAQVQIDFDAIEKLSKVAREQYAMAGAVQHGASTLPPELFDKFPKLGACEIHLATEFQNMIFDHPKFPAELKKEIYEKLRTLAADERKPTDTDEQFFYKTRKKALGPFKKQMWSLPRDMREAIGASLEEKFAFLITRLAAANTRSLAERWAPFVPSSFPRSGAGLAAARGPEDVSGLSD